MSLQGEVGKAAAAQGGAEGAAGGCARAQEGRRFPAQRAGAREGCGSGGEAQPSAGWHELHAAAGGPRLPWPHAACWAR